MPNDFGLAMASALRAVRAAGDAVYSLRCERLSAVPKGHHLDLVTRADFEAEEIIRRALAETLPDIPVVGEEGGGEIPAAGCYWTVDPLDGTANYVAGLPFYCTVAALICQGRPVVAAIYAPEQDELFQASAGAGALLNGQAIRVAPVDRLERLVVAARPSLDRRRGLVDNLAQCAGLTSACLGIRSLGSSALELAWVACGRFGAMYHPHLHPWDVAAGALLVEEAGGVVGQADSKPLSFQHRQSVLASNGHVHQAMCALVDLKPA